VLPKQHRLRGGSCSGHLAVTVEQRGYGNIPIAAGPASARIEGPDLLLRWPLRCMPPAPRASRLRVRAAAAVLQNWPAIDLHTSEVALAAPGRTPWARSRWPGPRMPAPDPSSRLPARHVILRPRPALGSPVAPPYKAAFPGLALPPVLVYPCELRERTAAIYGRVVHEVLGLPVFLRSTGRCTQPLAFGPNRSSFRCRLGPRNLAASSIELNVSIRTRW
jgi:hypothetical protein